MLLKLLFNQQVIPINFKCFDSYIKHIGFCFLSYGFKSVNSPFAMVDQQVTQMDIILNSAQHNAEAVLAQDNEITIHPLTNVSTKNPITQKITINSTALGNHPKNTLHCLIKGKKQHNRRDTVH